MKERDKVKYIMMWGSLLPEGVLDSRPTTPQRACFVCSWKQYSIVATKTSGRNYEYKLVFLFAWLRHGIYLYSYWRSYRKVFLQGIDMNLNIPSFIAGCIGAMAVALLIVAIEKLLMK